MRYTDLKMFGLLSCDSCGSVVPSCNVGLHGTWHEKIGNHTHTYSATFGQGSHWDEAGPARDHNCAYANDPRRCAWPGHRR